MRIVLFMFMLRCLGRVRLGGALITRHGCDVNCLSQLLHIDISYCVFVERKLSCLKFLIKSVFYSWDLDIKLHKLKKQITHH